jgi:hypothetical protein
MHSATNLGMGQHPRALTQLIQAYKAAGYKFVAVEDYVRVSAPMHWLRAAGRHIVVAHCTWPNFYVSGTRSMLLQTLCRPLLLQHAMCVLYARNTCCTLRHHLKQASACCCS